MSGPTLRSARPTDAGRVGAILSAFIDETPWMPRIHSRAEDLSFAGHMIERGWVTVAETDSGIAGFVAREGASVHALYVLGDQRDQGIGAALIRRMQHDHSELSLWTFQKNAGAQRFYLRHGFTEAERTEGAGNDEQLPDIRYVWQEEDI